MRILFLFFALFAGCASSEKVTQLESRTAKLEAQLNSAVEQINLLEQSNADLSNQILLLQDVLKSNPATSDNIKTEIKKPEQLKESEQLNQLLERKRCQAITKAGTQCKRMAEPGSDYCWQHQNYNSTKTKVTPSSDKTIYTGPRGGQYYYNSKGKKVYIKKK